MESTVRSISDLLNEIKKEKEDYPHTIWFRGQSNKDWKLIPGLLRKTAKMSESSILARFKQSAAMLASNKPSNSFDWIFLMQHYGIPTRLLDWSENPLVALYFATSEENDTDSALWILKPSLLNLSSNIGDDNEGDYIPSFDDEVLQGYSVEQYKSASAKVKLKPVATIATRNSSRIQAQLGTFTIHYKDATPIEEIGDGSHCKKITIPKSCKSVIRNELSLLGINRFSLFPEMESISATVLEAI